MEIPVDVVVAVIGATGLVIAAVVAAIGTWLGRKVTAVHTEVRTNHGKRQGQYIEDMAEFAENVRDFMLESRTDRTQLNRTVKGLATTVADRVLVNELEFTQLEEKLGELSQAVQEIKENTSE